MGVVYSTRFSASLQHVFPPRRASSHCCQLDAFPLFNIVCSLSEGRNEPDWICLETDYLNLFANSFHLFLVDDHLGCYARGLCLI